MKVGEHVFRELSRDLNLELIVQLCKELAKAGLNVGMSDAKPAAIVRHSDIGPLLITVDETGEYFVWREGQCRHPVIDPAGVARIFHNTLFPDRPERNDS